MSIKEHPPHSSLHVPVLLEASLKALQPQAGESYLDLTAGYGGHADAVMQATGNYSDSVLVDRDDYALGHLKSLSDKGCRLMHTDFVDAAKQLIQEGKAFDIVMIDLGVSSPQLDQSERGFSFKNSGPLDMRMDRRQELSAQEVVNTYGAEDLKRIIVDYGEEPPKLAGKIAAAIVQNRPFKETSELADLIADNYRGRRGRIHPATRTFQALRIAVNDELGQVEEVLELLPSLLNKNGKLAVISFHSLEDRLVKRYFKEQSISGYEADLQILTKKPVSGANEDVHNPRSRSARLRGAVKK